MSAFVPVFNNPQLERSLLSFIKNQEPALSGAGLSTTLTSINAHFGAKIKRPKGTRNVVPFVLLNRETNSEEAISCHDPRMLRLQRDVCNDLEAIGVSRKIGSVITGDCINRSAKTLLTHNGYIMDPGLSPNPKLTGTSKVPPPALYYRVLAAVSKVYSETYVPTTVRVNDISQSGVPYYTHDAKDKLAFIERIVHDGERPFAALAERDLNHWAIKYGSAPIVTITHRYQLDAFDKVRSGHNALGYEVTANKRVDPADAAGIEMGRCRERVAYAVSTMASLVFQCYFAGIRKQALETYAKTWHIRYSQEIVDCIESYGYFSLYDASKFDQTFLKEELECIIENLQHMSDMGKRALRTVHSLPLLINSDMEGQAFAYLINSVDYSPGLQSGTPDVSDFGKIKGTACWFYALMEMGAVKAATESDLIREVKKFLSHENPRFACINQGDDTLALAKSEKDLRQWEKVIESFEFCTWEKDDGCKFTGRLLTKLSPASKIQVYGDIITFCERTLLPERSFWSKHRPYSAMGVMQRYHDSISHPAFGKVMPILDKRFHEHFGRDFLKIFEPLYEIEKSRHNVVADVNSYNEATREVMIDPDKLHYRYKIEDIHPDVLKSLFPNNIDPETSLYYLTNCGILDESFGKMKRTAQSIEHALHLP